MGGLMSITGHPGGGPVRAGIPVADLSAGLLAAQGILVALLERERSGEGQWVHTSLLEAMVSMLDFQATRWLMGHEVPPQAGNNHPTVIPTGTFKVKDGYINVASTNHMWKRLCALLEAPDLAEDERFSSPGRRSRNRDALNPILEEKLQHKTAAEWIAAFNDAGIPCGPILSVDQVFADAQIQHLGLAQPVRASGARHHPHSRPAGHAQPHPGPRPHRDRGKRRAHGRSSPRTRHGRPRNRTTPPGRGDLMDH